MDYVPFIIVLKIILIVEICFPHPHLLGFIFASSAPIVYNI